MKNNHNFFWFFRISWVNFKKNIPAHGISLGITTVIIGILFLINILYFSGVQFIDAINSENSIVIKKEMHEYSDILTLETVQKIDQSLKGIPTVRSSYDFFLKIPTSIHLNYANLVQFTTDIFFEAYDFEVLKKGKYTQLHEPEAGKIWIILPSKIIFLLNNTAFDSITRDTIGFLNGEIFFWKSTVSEWKNMKSESFYVEGLSDDLPVYAVAIDFWTIFPLLDHFHMAKDKMKVMEMKINYGKSDDLERIQRVLKDIELQHQSTFVHQNIGEENETLKNRYSMFIRLIGSVTIVSIIGMILYIFSLKTALSLEKNKKNIQTLKYLGLGNFSITNIYFLEYLMVFLGSFMIFFITSALSTETMRNYTGNTIAFMIWMTNFRYETHYGVLLIECIGILACMYFIMWKVVSKKI